MSLNLEKILKTYRCIAKIPSVTNAKLLTGLDSRYKLESTWQERDLERSENVSFLNTTIFGFNGPNPEIVAKIPGDELNKVVLSSYSNSGDRKAVIREVVSKDSKSQYLEVWCKGRKIINVNLKDADKHGTVLSNDQFASFQWSYDDKKLLYIAEKKEAKSCSFFNIKKKDGENPGNEHVWKENWGEQLVDAHCPTLCVFDTETESVCTYEDYIPSVFSAGQACWLTDNQRVVFVGWKHDPYRLGLIYCPVRESKLFQLDTQSHECNQISDDGVAVRSPRLHPDGRRVFYLENQIGGPHFQCSRLMCAMISGDASCSVKTSVVVDIVKQPNSEDAFQGIYEIILPERCFSRDGSFLFMSPMFRSHVSVVSIKISNGDVKLLTRSGWYDVLDVCDDIIVASHSDPITPPELVVGKAQDGIVDKWHSVLKPGADVEGMSWNVRSFVPNLPNVEYPNVSPEYILYSPVTGDLNLKTLILFPHGGPHVASPTCFTHSIVTLCKLGFAVAQINYRGSAGFGQDSIDSLPGHVGKQDVSDVQQVANILKDTGDYDRVLITGGSHGGFLTLHLISQFPDFYSAACVRNPVTNMAIMNGTTDIPDWNYCESGKKFEFDKLPTAEDYRVMIEKSPISLLKCAKAPCLMMIGDVDLRVPKSQGLLWANMYRALGGTCKVLMYKDNNHPLNKVDAEADAFVNMVLWFMKHGKIANIN